MKGNIDKKILELTKWSNKKIKQLIGKFKCGNNSKLEKIFNNKILLSSITICVVGLLTLMFSLINTKEQGEVLDYFQKAIESKNEAMVSRCLRADDKKVKKKEVEPLIRYFIEGSGNLTEEIESLKNTGVSDLFKIKLDNGVFVDKYYININKVSATIKSDLENIKVHFNESELGKKVSIENLMPGLYDLTYSITTEYGDIKEVKKEEIIHNTTIDINLPVTYITINSNFEDAKVILNGKDSKKLVKEFKNIGPIPKNRGVKVYLEKEFPWGIIKSEEFEIKDENYIKIDLNIANDKVMEEIQISLENFFESVFSALNYEDKALIKADNHEVKEKIYDTMEKKTFIFKNNYEISDLELRIDNSEFNYKEGIYKANIVVDVNYSIYKKFLKFNEKKYSNLFLVTLLYSDEMWRVEDIQGFNLDA